MRQESEDLKSLEKFELVIPAKDLLDTVMGSANALTQMPIDEKRAKDLRLVLGFLNAYIRAFHTKMGYIKMVAIPEKVKSAMKKRLEKFK